MGRGLAQSIDVYMHAHHLSAPKAVGPLHRAHLDSTTTSCGCAGVCPSSGAAGSPNRAVSKHPSPLGSSGSAAPGDRRTPVAVSRCTLLPLVFLLSLLAQPVRGELPLARLFTVFPPGAQAGSAIEVSLNGADLDEPAQLLFSSTNIAGKPKPG